MDKTDETQNLANATLAETTTPDMGIPFESCLIDGVPDPCMVVIVGASGDLTAEKSFRPFLIYFLRVVCPIPSWLLDARAPN